jgi:hypothetical protein
MVQVASPSLSPSPSSTHTADTDAQAAEPVTAADVDGGDLFAAEAMTAFVDRTLPYDQWWAQLAPYLSASALVAYEYTDPTNVPASAVTGDPLVVAAPDGTTLSVLVPTDQGQYRVELERQSDQAAWAVSRFTPPEGLS